MRVDRGRSGIGGAGAAGAAAGLGPRAAGFALVTLPVGLYFAPSEASAWRATWGKRRLGLAAVGPGGARLGLGRSLARTWLSVGASVLGIAVGRRAVYDVVAGTRVVRG